MHAELATADTPHADLEPGIRDRWSPRAFDAAHRLAPRDAGLLFEAARWAPSAGNSQPWAYLVGLRGDPTFGAIHERLAGGNTVWGGRASALVITLHQTAPEAGSDLPYSDYAAYDLGQATAQLALQAHAQGLHTHQFAGFDHAGIAEEFGVPSHWTVTTGVAIGRLSDPDTLPEALAARERAPRSRRPVSTFVFAGRFGTASALVTSGPEHAGAAPSATT